MHLQGWPLTHRLSPVWVACPYNLVHPAFHLFHLVSFHLKGGIQSQTRLRRVPCKRRFRLLTLQHFVRLQPVHLDLHHCALCSIYNIYIYIYTHLYRYTSYIDIYMYVSRYTSPLYPHDISMVSPCRQPCRQAWLRMKICGPRAWKAHNKNRWITIDIWVFVREIIPKIHHIQALMAY